MTTNSPVISINITKTIPFDGEGDSLLNRLRNMKLRGFSDVKIYENSSQEIKFLTPEEIERELHTPQTRAYQTHLDRIEKLRDLFQQKEIDILDLKNAHDYTAIHESGEQTEWTILPPIIERFYIPKSPEGKLDYAPLIGKRLAETLSKKQSRINPDVLALDHTSETEMFDLINDGTHRIHYGFQNKGIRILILSNITRGFPYYAAPQKYKVKVFPTRESALEETETKVHIIQSPEHKSLYRVFPSGGIKSGDVRPH